MRRRVIFMLAVWVCVYPLVTLLLAMIAWLDLRLPLALQTLLLTAVVVPAMVLGIVPRVSCLVMWLFSKSQKT